MGAREGRAAELCTRSVHHGSNDNLICYAHLLPDPSRPEIPYGSAEGRSRSPSSEAASQRDGQEHGYELV